MRLADQHKERMDAVPDEIVAWWNDKFEGLKKANAGMAYSLNHALANYDEINGKYASLLEEKDALADDIVGLQVKVTDLTTKLTQVRDYLNEQHTNGNGVE